jgi:cytochrome c5
MSSEAHDEHSSFIKTPQQLIVVILLAFLVPIIGIILLVKLVTGQPSADPNAMTPDAVAKRIQPVGKVEFGAASGGAAGARTGEQIVKATCGTCHVAGVANAPKIGDAKAWAPHIKEGLPAMVATTVKGKGAMPPKGGDASLTDDELARAIAYMANQSGGKFKEPPVKVAVSQEKPKPGAPTAAGAAADGKTIYDKVCVACHQVSVAGSPKLGDKAAWAPRIKTGTDAMLQSVIKGKGAMPPKAGTTLSDAELRSAIEFMVAQSK